MQESYNKKQLITVKEARKLLGKQTKNLTDEDIKQLIVDTERLARLTVREYMVRNSEMVK